MRDWTSIAETQRSDLSMVGRCSKLRRDRQSANFWILSAGLKSDAKMM